MTAEALRAGVVAQDGAIAARFRGYLEGLDYFVVISPEATLPFPSDLHVVLYHVPSGALRAERRARPRPFSPAREGAPSYWLDVLSKIHQRAPDTPIVVALPPGEAGDKALDSGATDVIPENASP